MIAQVITENGQKKIMPLTADAGAGNPVGTIIPMYKKSSPSGYLYCDGTTFDQNAYPLLYAYLGSNVLPDYREFALVGAEKNTTDVFDSTETDPSTGLPGTQNHDVYAQGEFKDDQLQDHKHSIGDANSTMGTFLSNVLDGSSVWIPKMGVTGVVTKNTKDSRHGTVTRGKRKAVYFYIKATSGLSENAQDNVVAQLNEQRSYSTEEVNTGKKWIDGKPIYRKVVEIDFTPNISKTVTVSVDAGDSTYQVVNLSESVVVGSFGTRQPWYDTKAGNIKTTAYMSGGNVLFVTEHQAGKAYIVCEYTKTTD